MVVSQKIGHQPTSEQSQVGKAKLNTGRKKVEPGRCHVAPLDTDTGTLPSKTQSRGDTQINGDGLILDMSQPEIHLGYWLNSIANNMVSCDCFGTGHPGTNKQPPYNNLGWQYSLQEPDII